MKTPAGYAAVPWQLDMRVWWYRKSSLDEVGVAPPTNWDELLTVGRALTQKGMYGFGTGTGPGSPIGAHTLVMLMINNGGGIFAPAMDPRPRGRRAVSTSPPPEQST
jgi:multiple sugar transport system substrate-binding protein